MLPKLLFSCVFIALGMAIVYFYARSHTLECVRDRSGRVSATITHSGINYCKKERIPAGELLRAELEEVDSGSDGETSISYRVRLIAMKYTNSSTGIESSNYANISKKIEQINYFIQESTQRSMSLTQDNRLGGYIFGGIFGIGGLIFLLSPTRG